MGYYILGVHDSFCYLHFQDLQYASIHMLYSRYFREDILMVFEKALLLLILRDGTIISSYYPTPNSLNLFAHSFFTISVFLFFGRQYLLLDRQGTTLCVEF